MHVFRLADILQNTLTHSPTLTHSLTHSLRHNVYNTKGDIVWPIFPASTFSVFSTLCQHKDLLLYKKHWLPQHQRIISVISLVSWGKVPGYQFLCCVLSILKSEASFHTTISDFLCWVLSNSLRLSVVFSPTVGGFLLCSLQQSEAFCCVPSNSRRLSVVFSPTVGGFLWLVPSIHSKASLSCLLHARAVHFLLWFLFQQWEASRDARKYDNALTFSIVLITLFDWFGFPDAEC